MFRVTTWQDVRHGTTANMIHHPRRGTHDFEVDSLFAQANRFIRHGDAIVPVSDVARLVDQHGRQPNDFAAVDIAGPECDDSI